MLDVYLRRALVSTLGALLFTGPLACRHGPEPQSNGAHPPTDSAEKQASSEESSSETDWTGHQRLDDRATPTSYELDLRIDPAEPQFSGEARIELEVRTSTRRLRLHAESLDIERTVAQQAGRELKVEAQQVDHGGLILTFDQPLETGSMTLDFQYKAPLDELPEGLYRVQDDDNWYAFTQFEPLEAREAFPGFDEPRFKTPFRVSLTIPTSLKAFSNAPRADVSTSDGWRTVEFRKTKPIPTYLVAFAVGPLEVVEASDDALGDVSLRVLTPEGKRGLADYALSKTPEIVRSQMAYFDRDFPFQKLDLVAVPNFKAGAMENVGLVTFRESILLLDPEGASARDEYVAQAVIAHETAHMWFGNEVTLAWWDDLWLNEAFATWMGGETLAETAPELEPEAQAVRRTLGVMDNDSLGAARAIRQPIEDGGDVYDAFDSITYRKGMAILRMFEAWMGEEDFREGVRNYIADHSYGIAETSDLLEALESASGQPVEATIRPFIDQPGVPLVDVDYDREACRHNEGNPTLELEQSRYRPVGSDASEGAPWAIPMCVRYPTNEGSERYCFRFDGRDDTPRRQRVELPTEICPAWVHPNAGEKGYYHWRLAGEGHEPLWNVRSELALSEKVALLPHLEALVRADAMPVAEFLRAMGAMADETHRMIVSRLLGTLGTLESRVYRHDPPEAFRAYAASIIEPHLERIGFEAKPDDSTADALLRPRVVGAAASLAEDAETIERAKQVTERFLDSPEDVSPTRVSTYLSIAARRGDETLWNSIRETLSEAPNPSVRTEMIGSLSQFRDPELVRRSLALFWTDAVQSQNLWALLGSASGHPQTWDVAWTWMADNYDRIIEAVGSASAGRLPLVGRNFCSKSGAERVRSFFSEEAHRTKTTERNLQKVLGSIEQCRRYRELLEQEVRQFIDTRRSKDRSADGT